MIEILFVDNNTLTMSIWKHIVIIVVMFEKRKVLIISIMSIVRLKILSCIHYFFLLEK